MTVRVKLILVLTLILVSAFISISLFNYNESRKKIHRDIVNSSLPLTRDNIYSEIQTVLMRPLFVSSLMANDTFLKDWAAGGESDISKIERYLGEIQGKYGFFSAFFVSAETGKYYYPGGILKTISPEDDHDVWYYDFVSSGEGHDLDVDSNEAANNILTVFINHRLASDDGKLLGVTGVGLKMDNVSRLLKKFSEKYGKTIFLVDGNGLIQVHHKVGLIENINLRHMPGHGTIASQVLSNPAEPATYEFDFDGDRIFLTSRYIPELEWWLIVEQNETVLLDAARHNFVRTIIVGGIATLFIVVLSILVINHFQLRLEQQADSDELTGLGNRRSFERFFESAVSGIKKKSGPFSIILLDVDGFKEVNDKCGHMEGDRILKKISSIIRSCIRDSDFCARWGGDEFLLLVDGEVDLAFDIAERIRTAVADACNEDLVSSDCGEIVTVSCGVAQYTDADTLDSLIVRADKAMYESKAQGKDKVIKG
ncbi:sensor domain-containing diguanylate cyclase [Maridesulfovibrio salexigens]|uniref:diguanylate cyclase n=1 Tax=Maridesulfovibrio salexigens (strain ATCC 14822 / DSM 2638 / NCIMB 8403 / VKM B-1763) TaxID=526222 RepID=C6C063_MARSD|nr:sensor domain-containing diguanylate cyclase [Maridesulfovibrio salexigens]ACS80934.1 diguanylate cyclase [Maridesulfovibrio salexigens DSM 2638]